MVESHKVEHCVIQRLQVQDASPSLQELFAHAISAQAGSHSPYSHFPVGAALLLASGQMYKGSNQENAAFPSGLCAERTAIFYAQANRPDDPIDALVISVSEHSEHVPFPCGGCLQVISEYEEKQGSPIHIYMLDPKGDEAWEARGVRNLLPFGFGKNHLEG